MPRVRELTSKIPIFRREFIPPESTKESALSTAQFCAHKTYICTFVRAH